MQLSTNDHPSDESLESYALGSLEEPVLSELEEHLLLCSRCQNQVQDFDEYHVAMKSAAATLESELELRKRSWTRFSGALTVRRLGWAMAGMAVVVGGLALLVRPGPTVVSPPVALVLETIRSAEVRHAPARRALELNLDIKGLPAYPSYAVETVDARGQVQAQSTAAISDGRVKASLPQGLRHGTYFIRLYSSSHELLREYGLAVD